MKLLLFFLLPFVLQLVDAKPADIFTSSNSTFYKQLVELFKEKKPKTSAEIVITTCYATYCHFEDKNRCGSACETYGNLPFLPVNDQKENSEALSNVNECVKECVGRVQNPTHATVVCDDMCTVFLSYPNREEWVKDMKQGAADFKKFSKEFHSAIY